ncbi:MAG: primosomal protein [Bacteroidota bacterium]|jgi:primosomal protein N' (replication factor Y)
MNLVVEVILPVPLKSVFDYRVPSENEDLAVVGMRVVVPFGRNKMYTGVIRKVKDAANEEENLHEGVLRKLKFVEAFPDDQPVMHKAQLDLYAWIAHYYFCTEGEVHKAALPAGLKLESEMVAEWAGVDNWEDADLASKDYDFMRQLESKRRMNLVDAGLAMEMQGPLPRLRNLEARGLIRLVHRLKEGYTQKMVRFVEVAPMYREEAQLNQAFSSLKNAPKQEEVLMLVVEQFFHGKPILKSILRKRLPGSEGPIATLVEKGFLREFEEPEDRMAIIAYRENNKAITFTDEQNEALASIRASFAAEPTKPVLLHGVTGSGKTHLYIELIKEALAKGEEVLYLLPEIALTQQIIDKVKSEFGEQVGVYHSRFTDNERVEIWQKVLTSEYNIVIGVRSAIFLPFKKLGLIVIDEEHDHSFKQAEPNPRYNARDVAIFAARMLNLNVLLGSATPAFETYHNARAGKFTLVEIKNRAVKSELPQIQIVDLRVAKKERLMDGHFSKALLIEVRKTLERREQVILFQNRRGFAPYISCQNCGHVPHCINCDISLTFHKARKELRCHYCGYIDHQYSKCEKCASYEIRQMGIGTEKIEEEIKAHFPEARIARMDLDTTRTRTGFLKIIRSLEHHEIDILVGTQMVSKGLDFENVTLVGVIEADLMLSMGEFRAHEQAYQMLTQVSGRAGRSTKKGKVLIQTYMPDNPVLKLLQKPFGIFYDLDLPNRQLLNYPPFTRIIKMELRHPNQMFLESQAEVIRNIFLISFGDALLGPEYPYITRLRNEYRQVAIFKIPRTASVDKVRKILAERIDFYYSNAPQKTLRILVDVDPG